jgi:Protein of unknown function (DUF1569)
MSKYTDFLKNDLQKHLEKLAANTPPEWGKMNAQQMIEHLAGTFLLSNGRFPWKGTAGTEMGLAAKAKFLSDDFEYPRFLRAPGVPEEPNPTRFPDLDVAKSRFLAEIDRNFTYFSENPQATPIHPLFGELNFEAWMTVHARHIQHHFKQFSIYEGDLSTRR